MKLEHWIFISPHFDDVALSCGGLVWTLTHAGHRVEIWTIMAGFPPDPPYSPFAQANHAAWGRSGPEAIQMRRKEDQAACQILNADFRYFDWPDAIYRHDPESGKPLVNDNHDLFHQSPERSAVKDIAAALVEVLPEGSRLVTPMGLGGHIDHRAVVQAIQQTRQQPFYYADYPYILEDYQDPRLVSGGFEKCPQYFNREAVQAWQEAVLCYQSQLSGFWRDEEESRLAINNYQAGGGGRLWQMAK
jgi:LmbE family N-acetylglucosaminyl deacetylase